MAVDHDSAGTSARPDSQTSDTITLATDADFAAAEAELNRLLTLQGQAADDGESDRIAARRLPIYGALIDATPTTPFQAAVVLRRLICPATNPGTHHAESIARVVSFMAELTPPEEAARKALWRMVIDLEIPVRELEQGIDVLYSLNFEDDERNGVITFIERGLRASFVAIKSIYTKTLTASQAVESAV